MNKKEIAKRVTDRLIGNVEPGPYKIGDTILIRKPERFVTTVPSYPAAALARDRFYVLDTERKVAYWNKRKRQQDRQSHE